MKVTTPEAKRALLKGLMESKPGAEVDDKGYTSHAEMNLLDGVDLEDFESDFEQGSGNELKGKFRAAHSSSALAANCFGPFKQRADDLILASTDGFQSVGFERKCPVGIRQARTPPNLDVVAEGPRTVVAIESKCLEHLSAKQAKFADAYRDEIVDDRRDSPWFKEMIRLREHASSYTHLDAAQLVKHAFGLANTFREKDVVLLYLFWEPANRSDFELFQRHRSEIEAFSRQVADGFPRFAWLSYPELWEAWASSSREGWLCEHVERLRSRYLVVV